MPDIQLAHREQMILMAVAGGAAYGLEIQRIITEQSKGRHRLSIGTIYPVLHTLELKGAVVSEWEDSDSDVLARRGGARRRLYHCTKAGREAIQEILDFQWRLLKCNEKLSEVS